MKHEHRTCDRCGKVIKPGEQSMQGTYDLCRLCLLLFEEWMESAE